MIDFYLRSDQCKSKIILDVQNLVWNSFLAHRSEAVPKGPSSMKPKDIYTVQ